MAEVEEIKVPLLEKFWPELSEDDRDIVKEEKTEVEITVKDDGSEKNEDGDDDENIEEDDGSKRIEEVCDSVRENIETALEKGEKTRQKLEHDNEKIKLLAHQISTEYEKYSVENMDDLFDDAEDEDDSLSANVNDLKWDSPDGTQGSTGLKGVEPPLSPKIKKFTENFGKVEKLKNDAYHRHLKGISEDVQTYLEKLISLFIAVYDHLKSATGRDLCYSLLEDPFFRPLWPYLLALFRYKLGTHIKRSQFDKADFNKCDKSQNIIK